MSAPVQVLSDEFVKRNEKYEDGYDGNVGVSYKSSPGKNRVRQNEGSRESFPCGKFGFRCLGGHEYEMCSEKSVPDSGKREAKIRQVYVCPDNTLCDEHNVNYCSEKRGKRRRRDTESYGQKLMKLDEMGNSVKMNEKARKRFVQKYGNCKSLLDDEDSRKSELDRRKAFVQCMTSPYRRAESGSGYQIANFDAEQPDISLEPYPYRAKRRCRENVGEISPGSRSGYGRKFWPNEPEEFSEVTERSGEHPEVSIKKHSAQDYDYPDTKESLPHKIKNKVSKFLNKFKKHKSTDYNYGHGNTDGHPEGGCGCGGYGDVYDDYNDADYWYSGNDESTEFGCTDVGKYPHPNTKNLYFKCFFDPLKNSIIAVLQRCPKKCFFDKNRLECISAGDLDSVVGEKKAKRNSADKRRSNRKEKNCDSCKSFTTEEYYFREVTEDSKQFEPVNSMCGCPGGDEAETVFCDPPDEPCPEEPTCSKILKILPKSYGHDGCHKFVYPKFPCHSPHCQEVDQCNNFQCSEFGFFPDCQNPRKYFFCDLTQDMRGFFLYHMRCPHGRIFDKKLRECRMVCKREVSSNKLNAVEDSNFAELSPADDQYFSNVMSKRRINRLKNDLDGLGYNNQQKIQKYLGSDRGEKIGAELEEELDGENDCEKPWSEEKAKSGSRYNLKSSVKNIIRWKRQKKDKNLFKDDADEEGSFEESEDVASDRSRRKRDKDLEGKLKAIGFQMRQRQRRQHAESQQERRRVKTGESVQLAMDLRYPLPVDPFTRLPDGRAKPYIVIPIPRPGNERITLPPTCGCDYRGILDPNYLRLPRVSVFEDQNAENGMNPFGRVAVNNYYHGAARNRKFHHKLGRQRLRNVGVHGEDRMKKNRYYKTRNVRSVNEVQIEKSDLVDKKELGKLNWSDYPVTVDVTASVSSAKCHNLMTTLTEVSNEPRNMWTTVSGDTSVNLRTESLKGDVMRTSKGSQINSATESNGADLETILLTADLPTDLNVTVSTDSVCTTEHHDLTNGVLDLKLDKKGEEQSRDGRTRPKRELTVHGNIPFYLKEDNRMQQRTLKSFDETPIRKKRFVSNFPNVKWLDKNEDPDRLARFSNYWETVKRNLPETGNSDESSNDYMSSEECEDTGSFLGRMDAPKTWIQTRETATSKPPKSHTTHSKTLAETTTESSDTCMGISEDPCGEDSAPVTCPPISDVTKNTNVEVTTRLLLSDENQTVLSVNRLNPSSNFHCEMAGLFQDPETSMGFYKCVASGDQLTVSHHYCHPDEFFDRISKSCVKLSEMKAVKSRSADNEMSTNQIRRYYVGRKPLCYGLRRVTNNRYRGRRWSRYPDLSDDSAYYERVAKRNGCYEVKRKHCRNGEAFSRYYGVCVERRVLKRSAKRTGRNVHRKRCRRTELSNVWTSDDQKPTRMKYDNEFVRDKKLRLYHVRNPPKQFWRNENDEIRCRFRRRKVFEEPQRRKLRRRYSPDT